MTAPTQRRCRFCGEPCDESGEHAACAASAPPGWRTKSPAAAAAARESRVEREAAQHRAARGDNAATLLSFLGLVLLGVGLWLLFHPTGGVVEGVQVANLNTMLLGQTLATVGGIFLAAGQVIRTR